MMKKTLYALASLLFLGMPSLSLGAGEPVLPVIPYAEAATPSPCSLNEKLDALATLKKSEIQEEKLIEELGLRREILHIVLDCAIKDAEKLRDALEEIKTEDKTVKELQGLLKDRLREAIEHYQGEKEKIKDLGLQASKNQAKEILAWKESVYEPLSEEVANLLIWIKNEGIMTTADERLRDVTRTVHGLKLTEEESIRELFRVAKKNLDLAIAQHKDAKDLMRRMVAPGESLSLIKSSLDSLAETYRTFFELSEEVKKILPL